MSIFRSLPLFLPSFFQSPFFTLSFSVSLLLFLSVFLPSFLSFFLAYFASLFLSHCLFALFLCFCFMKRTSKYHIRQFFHQLFLFVGSCLALSFKPLFLIRFFPSFKLCFLVTSMFVCFKKDNLENTNYWSSWGVQPNVFWAKLG